mmetsp:Transcript_10079/g.28948  ORF Transcript_10079/g.28948 Transcript_10079/m.28948 type:complete len:111 (-) Transcript_10079:157-489(-)
MHASPWLHGGWADATTDSLLREGSGLKHPTGRKAAAVVVSYLATELTDRKGNGRGPPGMEEPGGVKLPPPTGLLLLTGEAGRHSNSSLEPAPEALHPPLSPMRVAAAQAH